MNCKTRRPENHTAGLLWATGTLRVSEELHSFPSSAFQNPYTSQAQLGSPRLSLHFLADSLSLSSPRTPRLLGWPLLISCLPTWPYIYLNLDSCSFPCILQQAPPTLWILNWALPTCWRPQVSHTHTQAFYSLKITTAKTLKPQPIPPAYVPISWCVFLAKLFERVVPSHWGHVITSCSSVRQLHAGCPSSHLMDVLAKEAKDVLLVTFH